jgi:hypothetical protein
MDKNGKIDASINSVTNEIKKGFSEPAELVEVTEKVAERMPVHALIHPVSYTGKAETLKLKSTKWNR